MAGDERGHWTQTVGDPGPGAGAGLRLMLSTPAWDQTAPVQPLGTQLCPTLQSSLRETQPAAP